MRQISLSQVGVAVAVFSLLALCALGVLVFGEKLHTREYVGIAMAVGTIALMAHYPLTARPLRGKALAWSNRANQ